MAELPELPELPEHWTDNNYNYTNYTVQPSPQCDDVIVVHPKCSPNDLYDFYFLVLMGYLMPPIIAFGMVSNILNLLVFLHKSMRQSSLNWYLACLSASDLVGLVCSFFMFSVPVLAEQPGLNSLLHFNGYAMLITFPLARVAQTISIGMTVLVSGHRYLTVCFPFWGASFCTKRRVRIAIIATICFTLLYCFPTFFELRLNYNHHICALDLNVTIVEMTEYRMNPMYTYVYLGWIYTLINFMIPFAILIVVNTQVIMAVHRTRKMHSTLFRGPQAQTEAKKERSTTIMLVGIVVVFLCCNTLSFVVNIIEIVNGSPNDPHASDTATTNTTVASLSAATSTDCNVIQHENATLTDIAVPDSYFTIAVNMSNALVTLNMAMHIFIYSTFSQKYRRLLIYFLGCYEFRESESAKQLLESAVDGTAAYV